MQILKPVLSMQGGKFKVVGGWGLEESDTPGDPELQPLGYLGDQLWLLCFPAGGL